MLLVFEKALDADFPLAMLGLQARELQVMRMLRLTEFLGMGFPLVVATALVAKARVM